MKKEQTYLVRYYNAAGRCVNFERFACKRLSTVTKALETLFDDSLFCACLRADRTTSCRVFSTPNAVAEIPVADFNVDATGPYDRRGPALTERSIHDDPAKVFESLADALAGKL